MIGFCFPQNSIFRFNWGNTFLSIFLKITKKIINFLKKPKSFGDKSWQGPIETFSQFLGSVFSTGLNFW